MEDIDHPHQPRTPDETPCPRKTEVVLGAAKKPGKTCCVKNDSE